MALHLLLLKDPFLIPFTLEGKVQTLQQGFEMLLDLAPALWS